MKKMRLFIKSGLAVLLLLCWSISLASAASFKMDFPNISQMNFQKIHPIHFKDNGNDFWWFIYFSNWSGEDADLASGYIYEVEWDGVTYNCKKKLEWFYYDSERWERLWPLDNESRWKINQGGEILNMTWWLFTLCIKNIEDYEYRKDMCTEEANVEDEGDATDCIEEVEAEFALNNWIYWAIVHEYNEQNFVLVAWVNYSAGTSWIEMTHELSPTFKMFDDKFPVWFIYDANWWIGFVWCELSDSETPQNVLNEIKIQWIENLFEYTTAKTGIKVNTGVTNLSLNCDNIWSAWNSLIPLIIQWLIGMGKDTDTGILWNATDPKMQYFSSANINNATLMNYSRQRAENLCRWKWKSNPDKSESVICVENPEGWVYDATDSNLKWRTIIVKNWDVKVSPAQSADEQYYDIFVGSGDLIIIESDAKLFVFKKDWFVSSTTPDGFNTQINNEIDEANNAQVNFEHTWDDVAVAALLKWNFIVNWWVKGEWDKLKHKYFIHGKFTTRDTFEKLGKIFKWRCIDWESNESPIKYYCPYSKEHSYTDASLVVIDQNYSSPLFR